MKKLFLIAALLLTGVLFNSQAVFALQGSGDGSSYAMLQETAVFFNNSGGVLSAGDVVILDSTGTAGTTLGTYVTSTTSADSILVVGVVKSTSVADQRPVVVVTEGPVDTRCDDANDAVTTLTAVGTTTRALKCGGGTNLGFSLEAGTGNNDDLLFVWVAPTGGD